MAGDDRRRWENRHAGTRLAKPRAPAAFLRENADLLRPGRTLDLACGSGRNSIFLARLGHRVVAVDIASAALRSIRALCPDVALVQMDVDAPGFHPASLDSVLCIDFLDRRLFPEIERWLRPGGVLLIDTFLIDQREIGHPRNHDFLLARGELVERLSGWKILRQREGEVIEGGERSFRAGVVAVRVPEKLRR